MPNSMFLDDAKSFDLVKAMLPVAKKRTYTRKTILHTHGEIVNHISLIVSGWVKIYTETENGKESIVDIISTGGLLAEDALLGATEQRFSAEVISSEAVLIDVPNVTMNVMLQENPMLSSYIISTIIMHMHHLRSHAEKLASASAIEKLSFFLSSFYEFEGKRFVLPCSKTQIAVYLGMERETLSRAFKQLKNEGCVAVDENGRITILDECKLFNYRPTQYNATDTKLSNDNVIVMHRYSESMYMMGV